MLRIAWRNIWRNKRRSLITMASIFFAVVFAVLMISFSNGIWSRVIDSLLRTQMGHIEIHGKGYWDSKDIDDFMTMNDASIDALRKIPHVTNVSPRTEVFAMASSEKALRGIVVLGIDPVEENDKSSLAARIVKGNYLTENDDGIIIGETLSKILEANIGDTLTIISRGYHGASASGLFTIRGIVSMPVPEMNRSFSFITINAAQNFIDMKDGYSGILIAVDKPQNLHKTLEAVKSSIDDSVYDVYSWEFTMREFLQKIESDRVFSKIILFFLYLVVGFGILSTVIMLTNERRREFGTMVALGMARSKLASLITTELFMMSCMGILLALAVSIPVTILLYYYPLPLPEKLATSVRAFGIEPILPMDVNLKVYLNQAITVLIITCATIVYPIKTVFKMKINKEIRIQ